MTKLLTTTAVALLLSVGPALAADDPDLSDQSGAIPEAQQSVPSEADEDASSAKSEDEAQPEAAAPQE